MRPDPALGSVGGLGAAARPWTVLLWLGLSVTLGVAGGILTAAVSPAVGFAGIIALLGIMAILANTQVGLLVIIGVAYLLPFGVIPVPLGGVKLTFLDASLTLLLLVWLFRLLVKPEVKLVNTPLDGLVLVFIGLALTSFIIGINSVTSEILRFFLKTINSLLFFFTVTNCVRTRVQLEGVVRAIAWGAFGASLLALGIYLLEPGTAERLLASLRVVGYPSGPGLLRYIATTRTLRAIGTSIDPNVLGGMLVLALPLVVSLLLSPAPPIRRRFLLPFVVLSVLALILTYSRSSWIGALGALLFLGALRYRRFLLLLPLFLGILALLPPTESLFGRVESGLYAEDLAAQMRLGEYKDALRLISLYPWFGVGFGAAPSIDLYIAASSVYLLIAEEMGLIGLSAFLLSVVTLLVYALRSYLRTPDASFRSLQAGVLASVVGALLAGVFDHYFFNLYFPHTVALFWLFAALSTAAARLAPRGLPRPGAMGDGAVRR